MGNPNSGKGKASMYEDLMHYQKTKKPKWKTEYLIEENIEREEIFCKLPDITEIEQDEDTNIDQELDMPKMQDFIDVIEESEILNDKDLSVELLFLMNYFIKMRNNTNGE